MIRAFNKQKTENACFEEANEDYAMTAMAAGADHKPSDARYQCDLRVTTAAVLGMGAYYVGTGAMEVGSLVANSQYISMVLTSVMMLSLCHYDVSYKLCMCETNRGSFADRQLDTGWESFRWKIVRCAERLSFVM